MELAVLIQCVPGNGYRASSGEPLAATAEGATRDEALAKLRAELQARAAGSEVVKMTIETKPSYPERAIWPDDQFTRDWLAGIAAARAKADQTADPWDDSSDDPA